jgi:hypothetical protein
MKKILLAAFLVPAMTDQGLAETIPAQDAPDHWGETATVVGRASVQKMGSGEIYLDLEGRGDGAPVSAYVSRWNAGLFWDAANLDGKLVAISGDISGYRGRPEIFLTDPRQIAVVKPPVVPEAAPQPLWIHIDLKPGDLKQIQHHQNQDRP